LIVFGGYGVFGSLVCRELARLGATVTVAGRSAEKARAFAKQLGPSHHAVAVDVTDPAACRAALAGHHVAIHCAGPFSAAEHAVLDACHDAGCHYVDIADDRAYAAFVRTQDVRFRARGLTAAFGCSSLPGVSGALAVVARDRRADAAERARITLFIGNDNRKSATAIHSVAAGLGRPIPAPQGTLHGFRGHARIPLPPPFGARRADVFESPDYDLIPDAVGVREVTVRVGFENRIAGPAFALLARLGPRWGTRTAALLAGLGTLSRGGSSGGVVMSEIFWPDGAVRRAALHATQGGQRLAAVPAALPAWALETGSATLRGAVTAYEILGAEVLVSQMRAAGFELYCE
jgi:hypothetical protein